MSGRHRSGEAPSHAAVPAAGATNRRRSRRRPVGLIALLIALAVVAAGLVFVFTRDSSSGDHPKAGATGCGQTTTLPVAATPVIVPALTKTIARWQATTPRLAGGTCVRAELTSVASATEAKTLAAEATPTVWIPESSAWSARLALDAPGRAAQIHALGSVASSPLVLVTAPGRAAATRVVAARGWLAAIAGIHPLELPDPAATPEGALTVVQLSRLAAATPDPQTTLASTLLPLSGATLASPAAGFSALRKSPLNAPAFIASEQAVFATGTTAASPVYPAGSIPSLDFPAVTVGTGTATFQQAAALLVKALTSSDATAALNAVGLRDAAGTPLPVGSALGTTAVKAAGAPDATTMAGVLKAWKVTQEPGALLAVIDVSGSMKDDSGNGQSKIQVVSHAAATAVVAIPPTWRVGLWTFAQHSTTKDWTERVAPGRLSSNRAALVTAAQALPSEVGGDTGLYDTALAAYQAATRAYEPNAVNSVVLMTDGANVDPGGTSLTALISALTRAYDPARPVQIITIAFGADADVNALTQISAATHGVNYVVVDPNDIQSVLIKSVLRRS